MNGFNGACTKGLLGVVSCATATGGFNNGFSPMACTNGAYTVPAGSGVMVIKIKPTPYALVGALRGVVAMSNAGVAIRSTDNSKYCVEGRGTFNI